MTDFSMLIPELAGWNDGNGIDVESWISSVGRFDHAIGYSTLFWPDFTVHDDCVFRRMIDHEAYEGWMDSCGGDKTEVEAVVNHEHILDLFQYRDAQPNRDVILYLGSLLKDMWSCKLNRDFPERQFEVRFPYGDAEELIDYQITFFQRRS